MSDQTDRDQADPDRLVHAVGDETSIFWEEALAHLQASDEAIDRLGARQFHAGRLERYKGMGVRLVEHIRAARSEHMRSGSTAEFDPDMVELRFRDVQELTDAMTFDEWQAFRSGVRRHFGLGEGRDRLPPTPPATVN